MCSESDIVKMIRLFTMESLGEETALKTVNSTIAGTEGRCLIINQQERSKVLMTQ